MEFLDKLILPQSAEHIQLLHYITILILSIFIPFISIIFGGTFLSIIYDRKFRKGNNPYYKKFSKDIIEYVTVNNGTGVILGIVPLIAAILIFSQLLHSSQINTISLFLLAFVFVTIGLIMVYTYRYSKAVNYTVTSIDSINIKDEEAQKEFDRIKSASSHLSLRYGKLGIVFLFIGIWFYVAAVTSVQLFTVWDLTSTLQSLFSLKVLLNFLIFVCFAFTLTGGAILFIHLYWNRENKTQDPEFDKFVKDKASAVGLRFGIPLPLLIALNIFSLSDKTLSGSIFAYGVISILLLFLAYHFFFMLEVRNEYKFSSMIFFVLILSVISLVIKDQKAISNSTEHHSLVLSTEYDKVLAGLRGEGTVAAISGKDIYEVRCASCHKFTEKLVGPAYFDVLPQFVGKQDQLVSFIRNPYKVNPAFPPMPNPGLKPQEAEAVAKYLLEEYDKYEKSQKK